MPRTEIFSYSYHPSSEFLLSALQGFIEPSIFTYPGYRDVAPTGTGKSWSFSSAIPQVIDHLKPGQPLLIVCPDHKLGSSIIKNLETRLNTSKKQNFKKIIMLKNRVELLKEYGIPSNCPLRKADDSEEGKRRQELFTKIQNANEAFSAPKVDSPEYQRMDVLYESLRSECQRHINTHTGEFPVCQKCLTIFAGNTVWPPEGSKIDKDSPHCFVLTYHKFHTGLPAFTPAITKIPPKNRTKSPFFTYLPMTSSLNTDHGIRNSFIIFEEASQGLGTIRKLIEDNAIRFNLLATLKKVNHNLENARREILATMHVLGDDFEDYQTRLNEQCDALRTALEEFQILDGYSPFQKGENNFVIDMPTDISDLSNFSLSLNGKFALGIQEKVLGLRRVNYDAYDNRWQLQIFDTIDDLYAARKQGFEPLIWRGLSNVLLAVSQVYKVCLLAEQHSNNTRGALWGEHFLQYLAMDDAAALYFKNLLWLLAMQHSGRHDKTIDDLSRLYESGLQLIHLSTPEKTQVDATLQAYIGSPEAMMKRLMLQNNTVYLSSASIGCPSILSNCNWEWIDENVRQGLNLPADQSVFLTIPVDDCKKQLEAKAGTGKAAKVIPQIHWGNPTGSDLAQSLFAFKPFKAPYMQGTLDLLFDSIRENPQRIRVGLIFTNSKDDADICIAGLKKFGEREHLGVEAIRLTAQSWKDGSFNDWLAHAQTALNSPQSQTKLFFAVTTFNSMKTGANVILSFPQLPDEGMLFSSYVNDVLRRFKNADIEVDLSDLLILELPSYLINENNAAPVAYELSARHDPDWNALIRDAPPVSLRWQIISALVKNTSHYAVEIINTVIQAAGRLDRTLNSARYPNIFLCWKYQPYLAQADMLIGKDNIVYTPTQRAIIDSAIKHTPDTPELARLLPERKQTIDTVIDELAHHLSKGGAYRECWRLLREFLRQHQAIAIDPELPRNAQAYHLSKLKGAKKLINCLKKVRLSDGRAPFDLLDCFIEVPSSFVNYSDDTLSISVRLSTDSYALYPAHYPTPGVQSVLYHSAESCQETTALLLLRPELMRDVVNPSVFEERLRMVIDSTHYCHCLPDSEVPDAFYEKADMFIAELEAAVDGKSWASLTMSELENPAIRQALFSKIEKKMWAMQQWAKENDYSLFPRKYLLVFRESWAAVNGEMVHRFIGIDGSECEIRFLYLDPTGSDDIQKYVVRLGRAAQRAQQQNRS